MFDIPILLVMFNRPEHAKRVFERIREARPSELYVAVDGPRLNRPAESEAIMQCQKLIELIDWPCNVKTLFRTYNLGCKQAVSSAINWFFSHVDKGIILEDDCLPDPSFFIFCRYILIKYENDERVMHVGGTNLYKEKKWGHYSYFFSYIAHIWGWATWRRAWSLYDINMKEYPELKSAGLIENIVTYTPSQSYWKVAFEDTYRGTLNTWDYQWVFTIWKNRGFSIIPNQNLISNIGFGEQATHTITDSHFSNLPTEPINVDALECPPTPSLNIDALNYGFHHFYVLPTWWQAKVKSIIKRVNMVKKSYSALTK